MGVSDEELASLAERVRISPRSLAFVPYADMLRRAGRPHDALQAVRGGLKFFPEHVAALVVLAKIHLESGQRPLAVAVLGDCLRRDPDNVAAGSLMAELLLGDGKLQEARTLLQRLLSSVPGDKDLQRLFSRASPRPAAVHGDPQDAFDTQIWAETLAKRGKTRLAAQAWARIAAWHPDDEGARLRAEELAGQARRLIEGNRRSPYAPLGETPSGVHPVEVWARAWWETT